MCMKNSKSVDELVLQKPVLVLGAGASIEDRLSWIKKKKNRLIIIAVDTVLPVLYTHRIKPDYIFILESQYINIYDFYKPGYFDCPVICDISSSFLINKKFKNTLYFFSSTFNRGNLF